MAQFVPVKIDVDTPEYAQWRRDHPSEGNTIPKLFVVRGDGETLYGKSGSLNGEALPAMLLKTLQYSGKILSAKDAASLNSISDRFEEQKSAGEIADAIRTANRSRKFGDPGKIPSYASAATRLNELVNVTADEAKSKLKELPKRFEGDSAEQLDAVSEYLAIRRDYGALKLIKKEVAAVHKQLSSDSELKKLYSEAKILDAASVAKTKGAKNRSVEKLRELIEETTSDEVKQSAQDLLDSIQQDSSN